MSSSLLLEYFGILQYRWGQSSGVAPLPANKNRTNKDRKNKKGRPFQASPSFCSAN
jgi:hypothetical protein